MHRTQWLMLESLNSSTVHLQETHPDLPSFFHLTFTSSAFSKFIHYPRAWQRFLVLLKKAPHTHIQHQLRECFFQALAALCESGMQTPTLHKRQSYNDPKHSQPMCTNTSILQEKTWPVTASAPWIVMNYPPTSKSSRDQYWTHFNFFNAIFRGLWGLSYYLFFLYVYDNFFLTKSAIVILVVCSVPYTN